MSNSQGGSSQNKRQYQRPNAVPVGTYPQQFHQQHNFSLQNQRTHHQQQLQQQMNMPHHQQQLMYAQHSIQLLESQLEQSTSALAAKTLECERLLLELKALKSAAVNTAPITTTASSKDPGIELDAAIVGLLEGLKKEIQDKKETIIALQQQIQSNVFTHESVAGKRLTNMVTQLESENKSLLAHLSTDSRIEHLQMQVSQLGVENLALKVKLQETEALAVSLDAELEAIHGKRPAC
ncbi:UNVERIFIED_CONTAM: hypothetical protein HDU68_012640 [Siphonaria sp. JEL0065]|nr:hypothetical protein HDU68_012640 [Siphonaria sp. JEL0065]